MPEVTQKTWGSVTAAATAIGHFALVVVLVVAAGWTLLKMAEWNESRQRPDTAKAEDTPAAELPSQPGGEIEARLIVLTTPFALIHGEAKMVPDGENSHIDDWRRLNDWVQWRFAVETPGEYEVIVEYACEAADAGDRYTVTVNGQSMSGEVAETGKNWFTDRVGRVTFEEAGDYTLSIKPQNQPETTLMRLKRILLRRPA